MRLYEIEMDILDCIDENGEIIDLERLEALELEREKKVENILLWIKNLKAEAEAVKTEKMAFAKRQSVLENKIDSLTRFITGYLDGYTFKTAKVSASFRKTTSVQADIEQLMMMENCDDYLRYKAPEVNKDAVKKAIEEGIEVLGCELVTKQSLIIK